MKPWEIDLSAYDDEAALLDGLRRKERLACTCLLKRFAPRLYRLAWQLTGDPDEAEDVLQEALIQACAHIAEFEGRAGLGTWLHRIVVNAAMARLRRKSLPTVPLEEEEAPGMPAEVRQALVDDAPGPSDLVLNRELGAAIEEAILTLPDTLRAAFVLRDVEGMSTAEAAAALGITESALKVRLHRARAALRAVLGASVTVSGTDAEPPALPAALGNQLLDQVCPAPMTNGQPGGRAASR
jgi:RNA polymerase sigma-70 factor (ECF subfamily)